MDGLTGDLQMKYQKVASEYSKVRAQVSVLKKAVLDEQTKNSEIRDTLKEKEQSLRKAEQEMDSLSFRNQQLTKRVTVLQEELENMSKLKKGKVKNQDQTKNSVCEVMGEELHKTITENARLVSLLNDKDESHKQDLEVHTQRIEYLEHQLRLQQDQHKEALARMEKEKAAAVISAVKSSTAGSASFPQASQKVDHSLELLQKSNAELTAHARELTSERLHLTSQLEDATRIIRTHLPFVDSNDRELNELNIPHHDRAHQANVLQTVNSAASYVEEIADALKNFHSHFCQRLVLLHESLSPLNLKFSEHLKDSSQQLHMLKQGYTDFIQALSSENWSSGTAPSLVLFSKPLKSYSSFLQKLQPYLSLSLEEESIVFGVNEELRTANQAIVSSSSFFNVQITKICGYVSLLAGQNRKHSQHSFVSQQRFVKELAGALNALHSATQGLLCAYTVKLALERESVKFPNETAFAESDEIITALSSAVSSSGKLADVLDNHVVSPSKQNKNNTQAHPSVIDFYARATNYLASLEQDEPPSVAYDEALHIKASLRCEEERCKALMSQFSTVQEQAAQAEREREHWQQEYQFLNLQQDSSQSNNTLTLASVAPADGEGGKTCITNSLGKLIAPFVLPQEIEAREEKLKKYFRGRLSELVGRCQNAESKATTFISECAVLKARLEDAAQSQKASEIRAAKVSEELAATVQSYNTQSAVMSEHLANMNEKLALQKDTIDHLKFQNTQSKGSKKGKQK